MKNKILMAFCFVVVKFFASDDSSSSLKRTKRVPSSTTTTLVSLSSLGAKRNGMVTNIGDLDFISFIQTMQADSKPGDKHLKRKTISSQGDHCPSMLKKTKSVIGASFPQAVQPGSSLCSLDDLHGLIELSCSPTQKCYEHYAKHPTSCKTSQDVMRVIRSFNNGFLTLSQEAKKFLVVEIVDHFSSKEQALNFWSEFSKTEKIHPVSSDKVVMKIMQEYDALNQQTADSLL